MTTDSCRLATGDCRVTIGNCRMTFFDIFEVQGCGFVREKVGRQPIFGRLIAEKIENR
jgi:hypothetical protein